jgi:SAM-dependent methyltransferase
MVAIRVGNVSLEQVQQDWDRFGENDPLWAVYSSKKFRDGTWDTEAFFESGRLEVEEILTLAEPPATGRCLDFGCGVGRLSLPLAQHFGEVIGVDIAPSMIKKAEQFKGDAGNVTYVLNDREDLRQFDSESFDFINASIVLQHMPVRFALGYLREFARLLTPAGMIAFTLPSEPAATLRGWLYRFVPRPLIYAYKRRRDGATMEMNNIPIARLVGELERAGLLVDKVRVSGSGGPNWLAFRYCCTRA